MAIPLKTAPERTNLLILIFGLTLIFYTGFLITANYFSQEKLKASVLKQLALDAEKRAETLSRLYSEYNDGPGNLAAAPKIPERFEITTPNDAFDSYICFATKTAHVYQLENCELPFSHDFGSDSIVSNSAEVTYLNVVWNDGSHRKMLAVAAPVLDTSFSIMIFTPADQVLGYLEPRELLFATGSLALLILVGFALTLHSYTRNPVPEAHLDESHEPRKIHKDNNIRLTEKTVKQRREEEQLQHLAQYDPLTNLPNRSLFNERLEHAFLRAQQARTRLAILSLDLDRFKSVNDTFGHPVGDRFLQAVARRISSCLRGEDIVSRPGGDEFIIAVEGIKTTRDAGTVAQKVLNVLSIPLNLDGFEVSLTGSIGISLYPDDSDNVTDLVKNSDTAMYQAKEQGRNNYQFYIAEFETAAAKRLELETQLRQAVARKEFVLCYQPQMSLRTGELVGAEALVRWQHPQLGLMLPDQFIPLAEETGLIGGIGDWVLQTACAQAKAWQAAGFPPIRVSVNVSVQQLREQNLLSKIQGILGTTELDPKHLELEVTENAIMQQPSQVIPILASLKGLGVALALDDFGTGYSSLSNLRRLNLDKLKIDEAFLKDLSGDSNDKAISKAIIALGHSIGLTVIAEGVETDEQRAFLKAEGCDQIQGFLIGEPVVAEQFELLLRDLGDAKTPDAPLGGRLTKTANPTLGLATDVEL